MFSSDTFETKSGQLSITFIGHATLMLEYAGHVIQVDPVGSFADFSQLPHADMILITHSHQDHFDPKAIEATEKSGTIIVLNDDAYEKLGRGTVMKNGDVRTELGIRIEAVSAHNTTPDRSMYHPEGRDNGYILTMDDLRVYIAGDTEDLPEMKSLSGIDIAFLPMNQPYTMTPEQVAAVARAFKPRILYPYHYGNTDPQKLVDLLRSEKEIDVRVRKLE